MHDSPLTVSEPRPARVEIIPLIDVIFFLLATFVLFTLSLQKIRTLDVDLPRGGVEGEDHGTLFLQATDGGMFFWKEGKSGTAELITAAEIPSRLHHYVRRVAVPRVFIRSDTRAKLGPAVTVFDEVRKAGIKQVSIETTTSAPGS